MEVNIMDSQCSVTARKFNAQLDGDKSKGLRFYVDEDKYRNSEDYQFQQLLQEIGTEGVITMARKIDPNWTQSELPALEHAKNVILNSLSNGGDTNLVLLQLVLQLHAQVTLECLLLLH
jgi:hypothetical protein